jgi:hemolysin activation/secretion protein
MLNKICFSVALSLMGLLMSQADVVGQETPTIRDIQPPELDRPEPNIDPSLTPRIEVEPSELPPREINIVKPLNVVKFLIRGNTVISTEEIQAVLSEFLNRPFTAADLSAAESKVGQLYADRGYLTALAILKPDDNQSESVDSATMTLTVLEGELETIQISGTKRLKRYVRQRLKANRKGVINQDTLQESLIFLLNDPRIDSITTTLTRGSEVGLNILTADVTPADPVDLVAGLNNNRSPSVGTFERQLQFSHLNVFGLGDSFSLGYRNTSSSNAINVGYSVPLTSNGGTLSLEYQFVRSRIGEKPFDVLELEGRSDAFRLSYRQPILRTASNHRIEEIALGVTVSHEDSSLRSDLIPFAISRGSEPSGRTRVSALRFFQEYSRASRSSILGLRSQFNLGLDIAATDNATAPDGEFFSWQGGLRWSKNLPHGLKFIATGSLQLSDRPLLPSEQISFGGQSTVRGFRQNLLLFDNGLGASFSLEIPVHRGKSGEFYVYPFFDVGHGWNNESLLIPSPNTLASGGIGLRYQFSDRVQVKLEWGIPLINRPERLNTLQEQGIHASIVFRPF